MKIVYALLVGSVLSGCQWATCEYEGKDYAHGASLMADCNECVCFDGELACTDLGCGETEDSADTGSQDTE